MPALAGEVRQASQWLVEEFGSSAPLVTAEWSLQQDERGRPCLVLTITDPYAGQVSGRFAPDEIQREYHTRARLYRLWGDLLQHRTQKHFDQLSERIRQIEEPETAQAESGARTE